jgi:hypothetical protein
LRNSIAARFELGFGVLELEDRIWTRIFLNRSSH